MMSADSCEEFTAGLGTQFSRVTAQVGNLQRPDAHVLEMYSQANSCPQSQAPLNTRPLAARVRTSFDDSIDISNKHVNFQLRSN